MRDESYHNSITVYIKRNKKMDPDLPQVAGMLLQLGAFLDYQAILHWVWRRRRYGAHQKEETEYDTTASSIMISKDANNTFNKEIDRLEARLETFRKRAQIVQVRGFHFGKQDERLPHDESFALLGTDSEASSLQRSSLTSDLSHRTSSTSLYIGDEATLAEALALPDSSNVDRLWSFVRETAHGLWKKPPPYQQYLEPCGITVWTIERLPRNLRSLDIPCPSSLSSYKHTSYFPETDTFFLPSVAGGPFEVAAAEAEHSRWITVSPERFWKFRESALKELRETGKLHWRRMDRWGKTWQEAWWRGEERPEWDQEARKWDCSVVRC